MARKDIPLRDGTLWLWEDFLTETAGLQAALAAEVPWRQEHVRMFGRVIPMPRLTCWMGDPGCSYTYSRVRYEPVPWTPTVAALRQKVVAATGAPLNAVLLNRYRSGRDAMGWHADDEPELGPEPTIASLSLGAARRFDLAHREDADARVRVVLRDGSLLVMAGTTQGHWKHRIPRTTRALDERINLTFRLVHARQA